VLIDYIFLPLIRLKSILYYLKLKSRKTEVFQLAPSIYWKIYGAFGNAYN